MFASVGPAIGADARYVRDCLIGAAVLFLLLNASLFAYVWGGATLRDSARTPSLYASGGLPAGDVARAYDRVLDAGAAAWQTEPWFALERSLATNEHAPPIWNPYSAYGQPLAANMQSQPYSPFAWVAVFGSESRGYAWYVLLRLYVAGVFALCFLRLFLPLLPAMTGAAVYQYLGYFWLYLTLPELSTAVLGFANLFAVELLLRKPHRATALGVAGVLAMDVAGGMPETCLLTIAFACAYGFVRWAGSAVFHSRSKAIAAYGLGAAALALGLSAILILPFLEYVPQSYNQHAGSNVAATPGITADLVTAGSLALYVAPLAHGPDAILSKTQPYFEIRSFFGAFGLLLALVGGVFGAIAFTQRRKDPFPVVFFGLATSLFILKRFGWGPLTVLGTLPGFRLVFFPKYEEAIAGACVAALAGYGTWVMSERRVDRGIVFAAVASVCLALVPVFLQYRAVLHSGTLAHFVWYALLVACVCIALFAFVAVRRSRDSSQTTFQAVAFVAVVLEAHVSFILPMHYLNAAPPREASPLPGASYVQFVQRNSRQSERFFAEDEILFPNWGAAFQIPDPRSLDALYPERYLSFVRRFVPRGHDDDLTNRFVGLARMRFESPLQRRFLALSSVGLVAVDATRSLSRAEFHEVYRDRHVVVYRYASSLPRAAIYAHVRLVGSGAEALDAIAGRGFDPRREAVVEGGDASIAALTRTPRIAVVRANVSGYSSTRVRIRARAGVPALLTFNDTFFPGWNAYVDGVATKTYRTNYLFRGVALAAGTHDVEFRYEPRSYAIGLAITRWSIALAALAALSLAPRAARVFVRSTVRRTGPASATT